MRLFLIVFVIVAMPGLQAVAADTARQNGEPVVIDFTKSLGKIRALHGVNNGPVVWGANDDLTKYHADAEFPSTRLHDMHYPGPDVVDIPAIFPIFDADADDPKYYCFTKTDAYLAPIVKNRSQITYRLGTSMENRTRCYVQGGIYSHPPKDYKKWAKICVNIIRHYNEGWANGFHYNIKYFEIWNEPDDHAYGMWAGTQQQYFELYEVAAKAIKAHDPSLKVGGPVACSVFQPICRPFLAYCRDRKLPLDFFPWHCYHASPQVFPTTCRRGPRASGRIRLQEHRKPHHRMALGELRLERTGYMQHYRKSKSKGIRCDSRHV